MNKGTKIILVVMALLGITAAVFFIGGGLERFQIYLPPSFRPLGPLVPAPVKKMGWAWRKTYQTGVPELLAMTRNGSRIVISVRMLDEEPGSGKENIFLGINSLKAKTIRQWTPGGRVERIAMAGSGKELLVQMDDGRLRLIADWQRSSQPAPLAEHLSGMGILSPSGKYVLAETLLPEGILLGTSGLILANREGDILNTILDKSGSVAEGIRGDLLAQFPFSNADGQFMWATPGGDIYLMESENNLWNMKVPVPPLALASSYLEGGIIAVAADLDETRIFFLDAKGNRLSEVLPRGLVSSLSCSKFGQFCASYGNGPEGQTLAVFSPQGRMLWRHEVAGEAERHSKVVVADQGNIVIAGFQEEGVWSLRSWDGLGKPLWIVPFENGLLDFQVSWSGKKIAALAGKNRLVFFNTEKSQEPSEERGPEVIQPVRSGEPKIRKIKPPSKIKLKGIQRSLTEKMKKIRKGLSGFSRKKRTEEPE